LRFDILSDLELDDILNAFPSLKTLIVMKTGRLDLARAKVPCDRAGVSLALFDAFGGGIFDFIKINWCYIYIKHTPTGRLMHGAPEKLKSLSALFVSCTRDSCF